MAVRTGDAAPEFDLAITASERVRLSDFRGHSNVLLVFHPFAFTPVCEDEARDLQENLPAFRATLEIGANAVCERCVCSMKTSWRSAPWL